MLHTEEASADDQVNTMGRNNVHI